MSLKPSIPASLIALTVAALGSALAPSGALAAVARGDMTVASPVQTISAETLNLGYTNFSPNLGKDVHATTVSGTIQTPLSSGVAWDGSLIYAKGSASPSNADYWAAGTSVLWNTAPGVRVGPDVGLQWLKTSGMSNSTYNLGVTGDWFANSRLTLSGSAGEFKQDSGSRSSGPYVNAAATFFATPNFTLAPSINYTSYKPKTGSSNNELDYGLTGTVRLNLSFPIDLKANYTHTTFSRGSFKADTATFGLSLPIGGGATIADQQHNTPNLLVPLTASIGMKF